MQSITLDIQKLIHTQTQIKHKSCPLTNFEGWKEIQITQVKEILEDLKDKDLLLLRLLKTLNLALEVTCSPGKYIHSLNKYLFNDHVSGTV